jgi:hypothetical protein
LSFGVKILSEEFMKKTCYKCKIEKDRLTDFYLNASACKKCSIERGKEYYQKNKDKFKEYKHNNIEKFREYQRNYWNERRRKDPTLRLIHNHRTRVRQALNGIYKSESSLVLLGCKTEELKKHIESLFVEGMNWLNYGEWEIDHIRPCSSFDLSDTKQQEECFHYTNLQPLWKHDNRLKSDKTDSI